MIAMEDIELSGDNTAPYNNSIGATLTNINTISAGGPVKVYYDHWENGYGTGAAGDEVYTVGKGTVLTFRSTNIPEPHPGTMTACSASSFPAGGSPAGAANRCYDGRDRVFVTGGPVSVAQAFWSTSADTNFANAWEIYPVKPYQSNYTIPVGENLFGPTYWDRFNSVAYSNSNGTLSWATTWDESGGDAGDNPASGTTLITGNRLRFDGNGTTSNLARSVNLNGATDATLSFDFYANDTIEAADTLAIQVYNGSTWTTLNTMAGPFTNGSRTFDIGGQANANTQIRFAVTGFTDGTEYLELDDVKIRYTTTPVEGNSFADFLNVHVLVQATKDGTTISIDDPETSGVEVNNVSKNRGETILLSHIFAGTTVSANHPVQVQFLVGEDLVAAGSMDTAAATRPCPARCGPGNIIPPYPETPRRPTIPTCLSTIRLHQPS